MNKAEQLTFDHELYLLIRKHMGDGMGDIFDLLSVLCSNLTLLIQCCILPLEGKLELAEKLNVITKNIILRDPNPVGRKLN